MEMHRMVQIDARVARLVGGGLTSDLNYGSLVFAWANGERFALALRVEQFTELMRAAALTHSQARKLHGDEVPAISIETWSTTETPDGTLLSLQVFGGLELRFELSRKRHEESEPIPED
jgi:hypothetical protein